MAAVLALPTTAHARAIHKPIGSKPAGPTIAEQLAQAQQQIAQMQAQLNALQARLDATAPAVDAATNSAAALATAQSAEAKADKAIAATETAKTAATRTDRALASVRWAADTTISGRMYMNMSSINQQAGGVKTAATGIGFNIKRMYIGIDHKFDKTFSFNVTADVSNVVGQFSNGNFTAPGVAGGTITNNVVLDGKGFYVKKAYLQARIDPALVVRLGSADSAWTPFMDNYEGHRHIESGLLERSFFGIGADWGLHVLGDLGKNVSYQVSLVNGATYRNVKVTNSLDLEGRLSANFSNFFAAVGGYSGYRGNNIQGGPQLLHKAERLNLALGYKSDKFTLGGEYFGAKNWAVTNIAEDSAIGYSVFGTYNFTPKWSAFGKYEWVKPNHMIAPSLTDNYFNLGIQWEPVKIVDIALVYKRDVAQNGAINTINGIIGAPGGRSGTYDEIGIFSQVRF